MSKAANSLEDLVREEIRRPASADIIQLCDSARDGDVQGIAAVLFYGSCLREESLADKIADLYLLVDDYRHSSSNPLARLGNWLLPPNVYYLETTRDGRTLRAKYAVISLADFKRGADGTWLHSYVWARFAQPCRLAWVRDGECEARVVDSLAAAVRTLIRESTPLLAPGCGAEALWTRAFAETYRSELRAERSNRPAILVAYDKQRYELASSLAAQDKKAAGPEIRSLNRTQAGRRWFYRRILGKWLSALRLMKAVFTFADGVHYIIWKIERHSGVQLDLTPWEKRHPILASSWLFWRFYKKGAFR